MGVWYYLVDQEQKGPVDEAQLRASLAENQLPPDTFVWQEGMENWLPAVEVPVFATAMEAAPVHLLPPDPDVNPDPAPAVGPPPMSAAVVQASMRAPDSSPNAAHAPTGCVSCQAGEVVPGYATPLCQPCRDKLIRWPVPLWLKIAAGVMGLLILFALTRVPREMSAAVALERGNTAEAKGDHAQALVEYYKALASYPNAPDVISGIAAAAHRSGDQKTAMEFANKLIDANGQVDKSNIQLLNEIKGGQAP